MKVLHKSTVTEILSYKVPYYILLIQILRSRHYLDYLDMIYLYHIKRYCENTICTIYKNCPKGFGQKSPITLTGNDA